MAKMIKMDLYRFFRSASTWIILFADLILAFLSVMLASTNNLMHIYFNAGELLAAQIRGGMLAAVCSVAVILFVSAKYKSGFIKNVVNQLPRREMLIFPEIIVTAVACSLYFFGYSVCTIAAGAVFFGKTFITFSLKLLIVQFILHWDVCCLLLLVYMLTSSTTFTIVAGFLIAFKSLNIVYVLVERLTHFKINQYMLDYNIFQIGMESTKPIYTRAAVIGLVFLLAEIVLLCIVMHNKDIK